MKAVTAPTVAPVDRRGTVTGMAKDRATIQREYRDRLRGGPPAPIVVAPHGTHAGWRRHQRHGEEPCKKCKAARRKWVAEQRKAGKVRV